jgi:hypothetical protein
MTESEAIDELLNRLRQRSPAMRAHLPTDRLQAIGLLGAIVLGVESEHPRAVRELAREAMVMMREEIGVRR